MTDSEAVSWGHGLGGRSGSLWGVSSWAWWLEGGSVLLSPVQGIVWGSVHTVSVHFRVGIVAGSGRAIILPFTVTYSERVRWGLRVNASRIVLILTY